jgi:molybdate transport system substrate-binding protein
MRRRSLLAAAPALGGAAPAQAQPATIFAAASLTEALRDLSAQWAARGHPPPRLSFAASSTLARQIEQGAPASLFISADEAWADYLQARGFLAEEIRISPIGNALVLIAARGIAQPIALGPGTSLTALLGHNGRLAVGDPAHVPAGRYARAALTWMGQWEAMAPRLARAENVRAALLLVERGEAPLGIVYATDAQAMAGLQVIGRFPPESHPPITTPFALTRLGQHQPQARALLAFLTGPQAMPHWARFGFVPAT